MMTRLMVGSSKNMCGRHLAGWRFLATPKDFKDFSTSPHPSFTILVTMSRHHQPKCVIDRSILNDKSLVDMADIGLSFFARLCGNNRGAFVVEPSDGKTYG
jgi:hypothetical protein